MKKNFDPKANYEKTRQKIGYVTRKQATQDDYDRIGFMSGLEVHQQLLTDEKLFCKCPAGIYQSHEDWDAELIRHMRPTLSELGEYDGTALMEFKTRKEIVYHIKNETACTYEVDDTPPFPLNRKALEVAIRIALLSKLNIVGEVHITRKQYLDGSIPTGFQRTAIIGVEGEIYLKRKKIRLIQLSLEEDSCREVSDIRHTRVYKTDRLGMPLIETVTYPDCVNPDEVKEACDYIRFLNRSTGLVRTGMGAGRQDVNVSCKGGTRVEIKGVAHTKWIPELTHVECFRQWALLHICKELKNRIGDIKNWKIKSREIEYPNYNFTYKPIIEAKKNEYKLIAVKLPGFAGILSHFTQPGKTFADEISERLKVIACIEKPHMIQSENLEPKESKEVFNQVGQLMDSTEDDACIIFWGPEEDIQTALETIEERCRMAFEGVPNETRKSFEDGSTIFERVLPGADRMYPDTDSPPIPLEDDDIEALRRTLPDDVIERYHQLRKWDVPEDTYAYIFSKNLYPEIDRIVKELNVKPLFAGTFFGHHMKFVEGHYQQSPSFKYSKVYDLFKYLKSQNLDLALAKKMLAVIYEHPKMDYDSVLASINFRRYPKEEILSKVPFLREKFKEVGQKINSLNETKFIMGQIQPKAIGNINLKELHQFISN